MAVLDSYASYRINQAILARVIWAKFMLGLPVDDELAEYRRRFSCWVYVVDLGRHLPGLHGCIAEMQPRWSRRFRVYRTIAPLDQVATADGGWSESWHYTLHCAAMILLPDVQWQHRSAFSRPCPDSDSDHPF